MILTLLCPRIINCIPNIMYLTMSCTIELSLIKHQVSFSKLNNKSENDVSYEINRKSPTSCLPDHVTVNMTIKEKKKSRKVKYSYKHNQIDALKDLNEESLRLT